MPGLPCTTDAELSRAIGRGRRQSAVLRAAISGSAIIRAVPAIRHIMTCHTAGASPSKGKRIRQRPGGNTSVCLALSANWGLGAVMEQ
jgi:glyoxylate carboligase